MYVIEMIEILAVLATLSGIMMSFGYLPQILKMVNRKSSADVSVATYLVFHIGLWVWLLYGIALNSIPLIISNGIGVIGTGLVICTYYKYKTMP